MPARVDEWKEAGSVSKEGRRNLVFKLLLWSETLDTALRTFDAATMFARHERIATASDFRVRDARGVPRVLF
jgi:hypothetical protein